MLLPSPIVTGRLVLSPVVPADAEGMVEVYRDERMYAFTGGAPVTVGALRSRYERLASGRSDDGSELWFNWIVRVPPDVQPVGAVQATVATDGSRAEVAWEIGVPWQGRGIAAEAAAAMVGWLVAAGVTEVSACIHADHVASGAVAAHAGLAATTEVVDGEIVWRRGATPG